jgi:hypothetical protein
MNYLDEEREWMRWLFILRNSKRIFRKQCAFQYDVTKVIHMIAHKIAVNSKPFSDGEFIK